MSLRGPVPAVQATEDFISCGRIKSDSRRSCTLSYDQMMAPLIDAYRDMLSSRAIQDRRPSVRIRLKGSIKQEKNPHHLIGIAGASRGPVPALPLSPFEPKGIWCLQPSLHTKESRPTASRRHSSERGRTSSCGRRLTRGGSQLKSNESARGGSQSGLASRRGGASATGAVKSRVSLNVLFLIGIHRSSSSLLHPRRTAS